MKEVAELNLEATESEAHKVMDFNPPYSDAHIYAKAWLSQQSELALLRRVAKDAHNLCHSAPRVYMKDATFPMKAWQELDLCMRSLNELAKMEALATKEAAGG